MPVLIMRTPATLAIFARPDTGSSKSEAHCLHSYSGVALDASQEQTSYKVLPLPCNDAPVKARICPSFRMCH